MFLDEGLQRVVGGKAGVRVRDWGVMRALPPPGDFATTAMINQRDEAVLEGFHIYQIVPRG